MTDDTEQPEGEEVEGELAVQFPDPIFLQAPDGSTYVIACEGTLCSLLGMDNVPAYRATDAGLEFLTHERRWAPVEASASGPKVASIRKQ